MPKIGQIAPIFFPIILREKMGQWGINFTFFILTKKKLMNKTYIPPIKDIKSIKPIKK